MVSAVDMLDEALNEKSIIQKLYSPENKPTITP